MIFLVVVWIVVIAGSGVMLAGWAIGPRLLSMPTALTPELGALAVVLAVVLADVAIAVRRARRR